MFNSAKNSCTFDLMANWPLPASMRESTRSGATYRIQVWTPGAKEPEDELLIENLTTAEGLWSYEAALYAPQANNAISYARGIPYLGLIDNASFGGINYNDTANRLTTSAPSFPTTCNWKELFGYVGGQRPALGALYFASGNNFGGNNNVTVVSYNNGAAPILFNANNNGNIQGAFIVCGSPLWGNNSGGAPYNTASLLGGPGLISAAAANNGTVSYNNGQIISVSVSITQTSN